MATSRAPADPASSCAGVGRTVKEQWEGAGPGPGERDPARVWPSGEATRSRRGGWGGARRRRGACASVVGEEGPHDGRVLHGYTVPYAIGNILLTAWGPVLVAMMSSGR